MPAPKPRVATLANQFTPAELKFIFEVLLDARLVLQAVDGGTLHHPLDPPAMKLELDQEIRRVEAALLLVAAA